MKSGTKKPGGVAADNGVGVVLTHGRPTGYTVKIVEQQKLRFGFFQLKFHASMII